MADPATIPAAPADLVNALWIYAWVIGAVVVAMASAFTGLGWYLIRRLEASEKACQDRADKRDTELKKEREKSHQETMAFVAAVTEVASVIKDLRRDFRETHDPKPTDEHSDTSSGLRRAIEALTIPHPLPEG